MLTTSPSSREHARLEEQARLFEILMKDGLFHAPVVEPNVCIDIGCGTGRATELMARKWPIARILGLDLRPAPTTRAKSSNVSFVTGDILKSEPQSWVTADNIAPLEKDGGLFDYAFSRLLLAGKIDWPGFLAKEMEILKPGGWAEIHELNGILYDTSGQQIGNAWNSLKMIQYCEQKLGLNTTAGEKVANWMEEAGFDDVQSRLYRLPLGGAMERDPGMMEVGNFWGTNLVGTVGVAVVPIMREAGVAEIEIEQQLEEMKRALAPDQGKFLGFVVTFGR